MATATILPVKDLRLGSIEQYNYSKIQINELQTKSIQIKEFLPFRVRITDVDLFGFNPSAIPPIPLQIIGISNYIL